MLPGIRILFATVILSASVLIFGLGAAALLRSAHEEFVGIPAWRAAQQPLAPAFDTSRPTLALLRVDPPAPVATAESKIEIPSKGEIASQDDRTSAETKTASIDVPATDKAIVSEKTVSEDIAKPDQVKRPRVRKAKRTRTVARRGQLIRHWSASAPHTIQTPTTNNSPFIGFDAADQSASSGAGSNRRTAARSPF